jgi:hypothetical protein
VEGSHGLELQAHDGAGNVAAIAPESFTIDNTVPLINISGVADGDVLAHPVAPVVDIVDPHLATSEVRLNGEPFAQGTVIDVSGDYLLDVSATDAAGNANAVAVRFNLDLDAPAVTFLSPEPGAVVIGETVDVRGQTEPHARIHLAVGSFVTDLQADAAGLFDVPAVPLDPGENTLVAHATDLAGNVGPESSLTVFREAAMEASVAGEIGVLPSPLPPGNLLDVSYSVRNSGGTALAAMPLRFELRSALGGELVAFDEVELDLAPGLEVEGTSRLDTTVAPDGSYALSMRASLPVAEGHSWVVLDMARLRIGLAGCRNGDVILADGFDGTGVRRDGVIFCDGFEARSAYESVVASEVMPWMEAADWLALAQPKEAEEASLEVAPYPVATVRAQPEAPRIGQRSMAWLLFAPSSPSLRNAREIVMLALDGIRPRSQRTTDRPGVTKYHGWSGRQQ